MTINKEIDEVMEEEMMAGEGITNHTSNTYGHGKTYQASQKVVCEKTARGEDSSRTSRSKFVANKRYSQKQNKEGMKNYSLNNALREGIEEPTLGL